MKVIIYDFETIKSCFLASFYIVEEDKWVDFLINQYQNDLYSFIKFLENNKDAIFCGFNNINFDSQVKEFIYRNYYKWLNKTSLEIASTISQYGSDIIESQNYNLFLPYKEEQLSFKQLDVPRILHWFNENKRVSLKQAEFELRAESIENFEVEVNKESFTIDEVQSLIFYCHNDVIYTYEIFKYIKGQVDHPLYKGKDKLFDRMVVKEETGLNCINWDDVKIGSEWNKLDYMKSTGKSEKDLKPLKVPQPYGKKFKIFFSPKVSYQSEGLKKFVKELGETYVLAEKQEFKYQFSPTLIVTVAKGGLHSNELPRLIRPEEDEIFLQNDIGSQYPSEIYKLGIYPLHLGKVWNDAIPVKIHRRISNKSQYKKTKDPKFNSLQEMGKLQLNGGLFGQLGLKGSWQEDQIALLRTTMGCEMEILMIVEALVLKSFNVTSVNTDGWDCIIPKNRLDEYFEIVEHYERVIGNDEIGRVEFTQFSWMVQTSVNDYAASKLGSWENRKFTEDKIAQKGSKYPHLKLKGDFTVDFELHKNSSFRIVNLALVEYFDKETDIDTFINNHNDIFDFCARSNSGQTYTHEGWIEGNMFKLPKLIRYYVAKNGIHIKKMVKEEIDTNANDQNVQPAEFLKEVCNKLPKKDYEKHLNNVNRKWYIDKALEIVQKVEQGKKNIKKKKIDKNQLSLF